MEPDPPMRPARSAKPNALKKKRSPEGRGTVNVRLPKPLYDRVMASARRFKFTVPRMLETAWDMAEAQFRPRVQKGSDE